MRLYLDDDLTWRWLAGLLRNAGHDVRLPAEIGVAGAKDPTHLTRAVQEDRVCLTRNYNDFELLHDLVMAVGGHHPGILVVRQERDRKKNLTPHDIVRAIHNLEAANYVLADRYEVLNHWR
jgi:predicted nuclease of predicted toxin-antitoxin system